MTSENDFEEIKERPSWLLPLIALIVTVTFGFFFWWSYLGLSFDELMGNTVSGTERGRRLNVTIGGQALSIPANYTQYARDRRDGTLTSIELFTILPDFVPYSDARKDDFLSDEPDAPVVVFKLAAKGEAMSESERIDYLLENHVSDNGIQTDVGLVEYEMSADSYYGEQDMFVFRTATDLKGMIRCLRKSERIRAPFCWRKTELDDGLSLHYRFRQAHLARWEMIDRNIIELVGSFVQVAPDGEGEIASVPEDLAQVRADPQ